MLNRGIAELLSDIPPFFMILLKHHVACSGCYLASFCNFQDAIESHGLDRGEVIRDLQAVLTADNLSAQIN
jgi:hypothetical protein